jgi:hypothetical protein
MDVCVRTSAAAQPPPPPRRPLQVACLLQANKVSSSAHMVMWRACRPGMYEYQLEAAFSGACMAESLPQPGNAGAQLG